MKLRSMVADARHDPDCATTVDQHAFRHVPDIAHVSMTTAMKHEAQLHAAAACDVHAFAEWFMRECDGAECVQNTAWLAEVRQLIRHRIGGATVPQLAHLGRTTRDLELMAYCRDEIERRWRDSLSYAALVERIERELTEQQAVRDGR